MAIEAYKLDIGGLAGGAWNQTSLVFRTDNSGPEPSYIKAKELVDDFAEDPLTDWRGLFPTAYGVQWIKARRISAGGGHTRHIEFPNGAADGTGTGDLGSTSLAPVVKLICGMLSNTQGRIFLPCIAEANFVDNRFEASYTSLVTAYFNSILAFTGAVSSTAWQLAVWSTKQLTVHQAVAAQLADVIGNQRRRRVPR